MDKLQNFLEKVKNGNNRRYKIFVAIFLSLMTVFVSSKLWLPDITPIEATELKTTKQITSQVKFYLYDWQYNPNSKFMEVDFLIDNTSTEFNYSFSVSSMVLKKNISLKTKIAYGAYDVLIVDITDVPASFANIVLSVKSNDSTSSYNNAQDFECDYRSVKHNTALAAKTETEYMAIGYNAHIEKLNGDIDDLADQINDSNNQIESYKANIATLEQNKEFQTESEIANATKSQQSLQNNINTAQKNIEKYNSQIEDLQNKKSKYQSKLDNLYQANPT